MQDSSQATVNNLEKTIIIFLVAEATLEITGHDMSVP